MSYYEATESTPADDDLWHVQLASGEVCMMTLDQLDDAFQNGVISENTYLWQEGATGWVTLREVAGLDSDEPEDLTDQVEPQANPFVHSDHASESVWPQASAPGPTYNYASQDPFAPPVQYAPPVQVMGPHSTAPVVSPMRDMDFDLEPVNFGRKRHPGRWLFAAALVGAAGFGAVKYNLIPISQGDATPVAPAAASPVPQADIAPAPQPPPAPVATTPPAPEPAKTALTDDVKARLANADKSLADKQKAKQQQAHERNATRSSSRRSSSSGAKGVFSKGGETGDPLNASL
jgi:hypothetical protein